MAKIIGLERFENLCDKASLLVNVLDSEKHEISALEKQAKELQLKKSELEAQIYSLNEKHKELSGGLEEIKSRSSKIVNEIDSELRL